MTLKTKLLGENSQPFSVPLRCKCSTCPSLENQSDLFEMQTSEREFISRWKKRCLETKGMKNLKSILHNY